MELVELIAAIKEKVREFVNLPLVEKTGLVGSHLAATGIVLLIGSAGVTSGDWFLKKEPPELVRQCLFVGFGLTVGGGIFAIGANLENDRLLRLDRENLEERLAKHRKNLQFSPCCNCKFFNGNSSHLYCAVNPDIACTDTAKNCKDFESK